MSKGIEIPNLSRDYLHACQNGDLLKIKNLTLKYDVQDWTTFRHSVSGDTPMHVAAREGHLNVVEYLCDAFERPDFKVNVVNKDMKRPLHEAAQFARTHVLRYLIEKGAIVDCSKRADWTPLMLACTKIGSEACKCIRILLEAKADPLRRNKDGWIPAFIICRSGDVNALRLFLDFAPESISLRSNNGRSSLHIAAFNGHEEIIDLLLAVDPGLVNARDSSGATPLHEAIKGGNLNIVKRMIQFGADFRATDKVGQTILHVASLIGSVEMMEYILTNNLINVHEKAFFDVTPLIAARRSKQTDAIDVLIKYGAEK
ncbi:ankyrin repeat domain-containing protein 16-like isoform X1 [Vespula pensylvanica]|uniref:ankyrin repeat domain-containing protein 16-like isoform X1 n=1 Tax=Vespula pensylvanica TaxID=30213 RepID=UPI001CBA1E82|nr:ankyrin repeat domain-containing protein 16-like isoform X1 [Vespula pensylvanica]